MVIGPPLVLSEFKVLPGLGLADFLAADRLGDLLLFLDRVEDVAVPKAVHLAVLGADIREDVGDDGDVLVRGRDELVGREGASADASLSELRFGTDLRDEAAEVQSGWGRRTSS